MKIELIDLYKDEFKAAYLSVSKDGRKRVALIGENGKSRWVTNARYVWEKTFGKVPDGLEVDHIDDDKTNDTLENLQLLSRTDNIKKESYRKSKLKSLVERKCPICGKIFTFEGRNLSTHPNPCCSRQCGYKKGALTKKVSNVNVP